MSNKMISDNLFEAIDLIVDKKINEAKYDSTILASINKTLDSSIGKYQIKYQDDSRK